MFGLLEDLVKIATAPVRVAAGLAEVVTKPIAELAEEVVDEVKDLTR